MALTTLTDDLNIIAALADKPNDLNGLSSAQLKAKFDESGNAIKTFINDTLIDELDTALAGKQDVSSGKGLSTEDYTTAEKSKLAGIEASANNYTHPATHSADIITDGTTNKAFTATEKTKLSGIAESANNYTHPTTAGNKHIPPGGAANQILRYSADGTAQWSDETIYQTPTKDLADFGDYLSDAFVFPLYDGSANGYGNGSASLDALIDHLRLSSFNMDYISATSKTTCSTAADTAAKTVSIDNFHYVIGSLNIIKFTNGNTAANPTLSISGNPARAIYYGDAALTTMPAGFIALLHLDSNGIYHILNPLPTDFAAASHNHAVTDITSLTATVDELNYTDGVTSAIQAQINRLKCTESSDFVGDSWYTNANPPFYSSLVLNGTRYAIEGTPKHPGQMAHRSGTSANSGALTCTDESAYRLGGGEIFEEVFATAGDLTTVTRRLGFLDTRDSSAVSDGVYINMSGTTLSGKTANGGTASTTGTTYTVSTGTWYRAAIELNSDATLATFTLYADDSNTVLWTDTLSTNIPKTVGHETGASDIGTSSGTTAIYVGIIDKMSIYMPNARLTLL